MARLLVEGETLRLGSPPEQLGKGAFGVVYRAEFRDTAGGPWHPCALKLLPVGDSAAVDGELDALAALPPHPNIVRLIGKARSVTKLGIATELLAGGSLHARLDAATRLNKPPSIETRLRWCMGVAAALVEIHGKGLVHGDVKAQNVMLDGAGAAAGAKLIDFGLVKAVRGALHEVSYAGTLNYSAPELIPDGGRESLRTDKADVYAFGCLLYTAFSRREPFHEHLSQFGNSTSKAHVAAVLERVGPLLRSGLRPNLGDLEGGFTPQGLVGLIKACWRTAHSERPAMKRVLAVLCEILDVPVLATGPLVGGGGGADEDSLLDKPITEPHVFPADGGNAVGNGLRAGMSSMQGWRVDMEDAFTVHVRVPGKPSYSFFAVFDGHNGAAVARDSARDDGLLAKIMAQPQWKDIDLKGAAGLQALEAAIKGGFIVQDEVLRAGQEVQNNEDHSGSTAVCAFVTPTHIVIANCGDSRALLASNEGNCLFASDDHKPYDEGEKARIEAAGGYVSEKRVNGDLPVSRALGDFVYKQFKPDGGAALAAPHRQQVSCIPDVTIIPRADNHGFLVLCCDGIWDVMTNEQVSRLMLEWTVRGFASYGTTTEHPCKNTVDLATALINKGLADQSKDNMSAIVVALPHAPEFSSVSVSATPSASAFGGGWAAAAHM